MAMPEPVVFLAGMAQKKGLKNMKFNFLHKQTSRREMSQDSATLAGGTFLAHLFPMTLLRASPAGYAQQAHSPADLLASMRAKFNAFQGVARWHSKR
jgi:hypothetical protein